MRARSHAEGAAEFEQRPRESWGQRVGALTALPALIARLGIEPGEVMRSAGVATETLANADNRIPFDAFGRLLDVAARLSADQPLGLILGGSMRLDDLGTIGDLARNAATLGEALQFMVVYQHLNSEGDLVFVARHDPIVEVGYGIYYPGVDGANQICDYALAGLFTVLRELAGPQWLPSEVFLPHARPAQALQYKNLFRVLPHFDSEHCSLRFPAYWLQRPVPGADPVRHRLALAAVQHAADADLLQQVYRALRQLMLSGKSSGDDVAGMLSMHRRTLNRRLRARGTTFQQVLDTARCEAARQLLAQSHIPLEDLASSLGFAGASTFARSFRRWTGTSPGHFRKFARARAAVSMLFATSLMTAACLSPSDAGAASAQYSRPYALFEPQRQMQAADTRPAFVVKVDGRNVSIDRSEPVPPGTRTVVVSIPGAKGMSNPSRATLEVDAKPCTRYYLAARRSSRAAREWSAFVAASEPITECARRFPPS